MFDPDRIDNRNDALVARMIRAVDRLAVPYHRAQVSGLEKVPAGPALFVGNHNGATLSIDTFIFCAALGREFGIDAVPYGLGHDLAVGLPVLNQILCPLGAVRASHENAQKLFDLGRKLMVYPGGDIEAMRPYRRRNEVDFAGRTGFAKLAIACGVPIVPVCAEGAHGTLLILHDFRELAEVIGLHKRLRIGVFPLSLLLPYGIWFGPLPPYFPLPAKIHVEVLDPLDVGNDPSLADDEDYVRDVASVVETRLQRALTRMSSGAR